MTRRLSGAALLALASLAPGAAAQGKIEWEAEFRAALAKAEAENKPIAVCISMQGERVCDLIVEEHYADPKIVSLSRRTVNLFCSPHGTPAQQELEKRVRLDLLGKDADAWMIAPQHVFFTPKGELMFSVPYYVAVGELEWMWAEALRRTDAEFEWQASDRTRAPVRLAQERTETSKAVVKPPSKRELEAILKEIKKGFGGYYGAREQLPIIVRHEGQPAKKFVERILDALDTGDDGRVSVLGVIAANSPQSWRSVVRPMLSHENEKVRLAAVETLRELGDKKSVKALNARWRKESSATVRGALLRAMVRCGPADVRVVKLVPLVLRDYDDETIRLHAAIAAASLEHREAVHASLRSALADAAPRVRSTAAWAIAARRELALAGDLRSAAEREQDDTVRGWMTAAGAVLDGGSMEPFEKFFTELGSG